MSERFEGFDSPNTTPVPDIVFDRLLSELSGAELKVLLYIIRRTYGFKKASDAICLDQFEHGITTRDGKVLDKGTGLGRDTITLALQSLEKRGCIKREDRYKQATVYRLRMKDEEIETSTRIKGRKPRTKKPAVSPENQEAVSPDFLHAENPVSESCFSGFLSPDFPATQETVLQQTVKQETEESVPTIPASPVMSSSSSQPEKASSEVSPQARVILATWRLVCGPRKLSRYELETAEDMAAQGIKPTEEQFRTIYQKLRDAGKEKVWLTDVWTAWDKREDVPAPPIRRRGKQIRAPQDWDTQKTAPMEVRS